MALRSKKEPLLGEMMVHGFGGFGFESDACEKGEVRRARRARELKTCIATRF